MMGESERDAESREEKGEEAEEAEAEAEVEIWKYIFGFTNMAVVKCAIELGIADAIDEHEGGGAVTLSELSSSLGCSPSYLYRIMRFLVHHKFFKENPSGYVNTPLSRRLLRKGEKSMADFIMFESTHVMLAPWHHLSTRVKAGGDSPFEGAHGDDVWKYAEAHPEHSKLIDDAMACDTRVAVAAIVEGCPEVFEGVETVVDVGGGNGTAMRLLVKACPWITHAINFDQPHVVAAAPRCQGVDNVAGNMFESIPKADVAFIKWVLHDWNDEDCIKILKNCREAISKEKGKVIIVEAIVGEERNQELEFARLMLDMVMLAHTHTGKERTSEEWVYILKEAGFTHHFIKPIRAVQSVIVAFP